LRYPFTFETFVRGSTTRMGTGGNMECGIGVMLATPGNVQAIFHRDNGANDTNFGVQTWSAPTPGTVTNGTTTTSTAGFGLHAPYYLRIIATSTSSVAYYFSFDGKLWTTLATAVNPGFTIGSVGFVLYGGAQNTYTQEAIFDYARFS
jgi:hypothetical protein